jgi:hypothetical protein
MQFALHNFLRRFEPKTLSGAGVQQPGEGIYPAFMTEKDSAHFIQPSGGQCAPAAAIAESVYQWLRIIAGPIAK